MPDYRNATSSWSGYLHQGKVGIFVALEKIIKLLDSGISEDNLKNWKVIYENAEDFDIQLYEDNKWKVVSRHQVKAYKDGKNLNAYKSVLEETRYSKEGKWICGFETKDCENSKKYLHTICEIVGFGLTEEEYLEKQKSGEIDKRSVFISNPNEIEEYVYPNGNKYCNLSIENSYLQEITNDRIKSIRPDYDEYIYLELLFKLDEDIRCKHINGGFPELSFHEIKKIIDVYVSFENHDEIRLRESFSNYWTEFKKSTRSTIKDEQINLLDEYMSNIYQKDYMGFIEDLKNIHFYDDFIKHQNIQKEPFNNVIVKTLYNSPFVNKDELEDFLRKNNHILTSCTSESDDMASLVYNLVDNISKGNLELSFFSGKNLVNQNINHKIEKFTDINDQIDDTYGLERIAENKINSNNGISLISKDKLVF